MHYARMSLDVVQRSQKNQDLYDFCLLYQWARSQYCLSSDLILTSRYQSIVDNRMKIERASNVVDVMEYS